MLKSALISKQVALVVEKLEVESHLELLRGNTEPTGTQVNHWRCAAYDFRKRDANDSLARRLRKVFDRLSAS